jgi:uncharacterized phosphosugar-binding protein
MSLLESYRDELVAIMDSFIHMQTENLAAAASIIVDSLEKGGTLHVFGGGGHSSIPVEEVLCRKGGFVQINPIYDPGITLSHGAYKSIGGLERVVGYAGCVLRYHRVSKGDTLLITSNYGVNTASVEAALEGKALGAYTIGLSSSLYPQSVPLGHPARHPSGKALIEVVDLFIDTLIPPDDCVVSIPGLNSKAMPVGTIMQVYAINALIGYVYQECLGRGKQPKRWKSSLALSGDDENADYLQDLFCRVRTI